MAINKLSTPNGIIWRIDSTISLSNTTTETVFVSPTIVGGAMTMFNELRYSFYFSLSTKAVVPGTVTIRLKYGTSTLTLGGGALALIGGVSNSPFVINGTISNKGTTSSQFFEGSLTQPSGGLTLAQPINQSFTEPAIDTTADQTFSLTAQFSVADAGNILVLKRAKLELS